MTLAYEGESFREENVVIADTNVFQLFDFKFVQGDPDTALNNPTDLVLTRSSAERYFGTDDPIGKRINLMGQIDLIVTAVIEDIPANSHMEFDFLGSMGAVPMLMGPGEMESWGSNNYYTYLRLPEGYDPENLSSRFVDFIVKHRGEDAPNGTGLNLQNLTEIHLTSNRDSEWKSNGSSGAYL